jgi:hypothetical protein
MDFFVTCAPNDKLIRFNARARSLQLGAQLQWLRCRGRVGLLLMLLLSEDGIHQLTAANGENGEETVAQLRTTGQ